MRFRLCLPMLLARTRDQLVEIDFPSLSRIERLDARIDVPAECSQLLDVVENLAPDVFLISDRQLLHDSDGIFQ